MCVENSKKQGAHFRSLEMSLETVADVANRIGTSCARTPVLGARCSEG